MQSAGVELKAAAQKRLIPVCLYPEHFPSLSAEMAAVCERMKLKRCEENAVVSGLLRVVINGCFYLPPSLVLPIVESSISQSDGR